MKSFTDAELKQLAMDIVDGKVLTDRSIPQNILGLVFVPLMLMSKASADAIIADEPKLFYEYYNASRMGRAINGYPMFASFRYLPKREFDRMWPYLEVYQNMRREFLGLKEGEKQPVMDSRVETGYTPYTEIHDDPAVDMSEALSKRIQEEVGCAKEDDDEVDE